MPRDPRGGTGTAWISRGEGPQRALLVHCSLASSRALLPVMDRLADALTMIAFDLPGHGRSAPWTGDGDYLGCAADMAERLCAAPCDLVGHSFGAVVALALMVRRPELVRRAVLIEPVFFAAAAEGPAIEAHRAAQGALRRALAAGERERAAKAFAAEWGTGQDWSAIPAARRRAMAERIDLVAASAPGLEEDSAGLLAAGRLERVRAPVLVLRGEASHPVMPGIAHGLCARLPHARQSVIPGAGHMAPLTHPDAVARAIRAHLLAEL